MEDLVTIINNLLQSHISWSEIVGKEELVGNNVNRNTRIFEKLVAKLKDFMDDSDNELNIALDNIVAKKSVCEEGHLIFSECGSDTQIAVSPTNSGCSIKAY